MSGSKFILATILLTFVGSVKVSGELLPVVHDKNTIKFCC